MDDKFGDVDELGVAGGGTEVTTATLEDEPADMDVDWVAVVLLGGKAVIVGWTRTVAVEISAPSIIKN